DEGGEQCGARRGALVLVLDVVRQIAQSADELRTARWRCGLRRQDGDAAFERAEACPRGERAGADGSVLRCRVLAVVATPTELGEQVVRLRGAVRTRIRGQEARERLLVCRGQLGVGRPRDVERAKAIVCSLAGTGSLRKFAEQ